MRVWLLLFHEEYNLDQGFGALFSFMFYNKKFPFAPANRQSYASACLVCVRMHDDGITRKVGNAVEQRLEFFVDLCPHNLSC